MTRDQVERLLEETLLSMEKRAAQRQALAAQQAQQAQQRPPGAELELTGAGAAASNCAGAGAAAAGAGGVGVVRSIRPLAEGEPLDGHGGTVQENGGAAAPGGSVRGGVGGSMRGVRSLSSMQQAMHRAYQGGGGGELCAFC